MALEAKIRDTSARNSELLRIIHDTESAVPDLDAQNRYVADLERQVADAANKLKQLGYRREQELKEHEAYRDSVMKRFAYKVSRKTDKFEAKAAKEEREYFDALQEEHRADVMKKNLDTMLSDAKTIRRDLEAKVATHTKARRDLDTLYDSIFAGPSPGYPEEDEQERETDAVVKAYHSARSQAEAEGQVVDILSQAQQRLAGALMCMEEALQASRIDMFGGGSFADMMERNALSKAEAQIFHARTLVRQAQRYSPLVRDLAPVRIAQGNILGDVFFDSIFTDMAFHNKIKQSNLEVQHCARTLNGDLETARRRSAEVSRAAKQKALEVQQARLKLQNIRAAAFERASGYTAPVPTASSSDAAPPDGPPPGYAEPPPSYTERADAGGEWWESR